MAIRRARYIENVESEALEAIARWSVIGKVVRLKLSNECPTESGTSF